MFVKKNRELLALKKILPRRAGSYLRINDLNASDAEIFKLGRSYVSVSVDTLNEEISWGLYCDPETIGWMAALQSLTDVAATGVRPQAVLLASTWNRKWSAEFKKRILKTYFSVLQSHQVEFLGGDTSSGSETQLSTTAFGWSTEKPKMRTGLQVGDYILAVGAFGSGPALGLRLVMGLKESDFPEKQFRPKPDLQALVKIKKLMRCGIDVSDGLASTLCILSELNKVSFEISYDQSFFVPAARRFCKKLKFPLSSLFFAEHGDYGFLVGVAPKNLLKVQKLVPGSQVLARVISGQKQSRLRDKDNQFKDIQLDSLFNAKNSDIQSVRRNLNQWFQTSKNLNLA
jgi:thiamin-phosphate kinase